MKEYRLLIADDENLICQMIKKIIHFDELNLKLVGTAHDGEELLSMIFEQKPDIVITDVTMPKISGIEVIRRVVDAGVQCRFIIISGYKQFEYVYEAMHYNVDNYILKPIDEDELNSTLQKVIKELQAGSLSEDVNEVTSSIQRRLLTQGVDEPEFMSLTVSEVNQSYLTNFSESGIFRFVSIRLDFNDPENKSSSKEPSPLVGSFFESLEEALRDDIICDYYTNVDYAGMCLLHYKEGKDDLILSKIKEVSEVTMQEMLKFSNLEATVCVSGKCLECRLLKNAKDELFFTEYARLGLGRNRLIQYEDISQINEERYQDKLNELENNIKGALDVYDSEQLENNIDEFFLLPRGVKISEPGYAFIQQIRKDWTGLYQPRIAKIDPSSNSMVEANQEIDFCNSLEKMQNTLKECIFKTMEQLSAEVKRQNTRPIKQAIAYVEENYQGKIAMDKVAESVGLSTVYFSHLFKTETGMNFTEYVAKQRIEAAKNLLVETSLNVSEVAYKVGFLDVRYFSKLFKKMVGVKPTDYRKIYD